jgi:putative transposase
MEERAKFVLEVQRDELNMAEICRRYGISRQTGYKWLERHAEGGLGAMGDRSHAPMRRPHAMGESMREAVLALRQKHPSWGPKKLKVVLERNREGVPATSTIGELLRREGLVHRRRRRRPGAAPVSEPLGHAVAPNDVWSIDYKGWFRTGDGKRCEPLTVTDNASRYLLRLTAMAGIDQKQVRAVLEAAFREHGLPAAIRSDNGSPFVTAAPGGLSELSIWWLRLGIRHERIEPGEPQQNGRHERFHWSLVKDVLDYRIEWDLPLQQREFVRYQQQFNEERPHEALGMGTPAGAYRDSARSYPARIPEMEYGSCYYVRRVNWQGRFLWGGERIALSPVLAEEWIGLKEVENDLMEVIYGPLLLGWLDHQTGTFVRRETAEKWARGSESGPAKGPGLHCALPSGPPPDGGDGLRSAQALSVSSSTG